METVKTVKVVCDKTKGNDAGYYICNADQVPKGAKLLEETKKAASKASATKK